MLAMRRHLSAPHIPSLVARCKRLGERDKRAACLRAAMVPVQEFTKEEVAKKNSREELWGTLVLLCPPQSVAPDLLSTELPA